MTEIKFSIFLICIIIFTLLDKGLTLINLFQIKHNFPQVESTKAEINPLNRFILNYFGLYGGTIVMFIFSIIYSIGIWYFILFIFGKNAGSTALYTMFVIYGFVVANNSYFLLKYSQVIP
jgi:hypothetical protein